MEGSANVKRDESWPVLDADEVGGGGRADPPYDRGVKIAQAVISQTPEGRWKIFFCSDKQVEMQLIGSLEDIVKELKFASSKEWHKRSAY
jgi:hypothetical protein